MNHKTRTESSIMNSIYALLSKLLSIGMLFLVRTVFVKTLSAEYLGVNGLFTNIISILSLADLGIGIAIPYTLYKPLADHDTRKINIFMNFYAKIYTIIGFIVLIIGISITPFLDFFIKEQTSVENLQIIYILFIVNAAMSYFFIYKKLLMDSDQKGYIASKIIMIVTFFTSIFQILILIFTKNYIFYLVFAIISTIVQNLWISYKCNKTYDYLDANYKEKIEKTEIKDLTKNIGALCIYRIGAVIMSGTDSIIISKIVGIIAVGIYSNYLLITNSINNLILQIFNAVTASIGNLVVTEDDNKSEYILNKFMFFNFWIYSILGVCLAILMNPFIQLWLGDAYVFNDITTIVIAINFYVFGMQNVISTYRNAYGLFQQGKFRPIIMVIANIILSIILAYTMGVCGVVIATIVSRLLIVGIFDPIIVYRYGLHKNVKKYFVLYSKYLSIFLVLLILTQFLLKAVIYKNIWIWIMIGLLLFFGFNIIYIIVFRKKDDYQFFKERVFSYFLRNR